MALATGQITIIDLNDTASLQGYLTSSHPKVQLLDTAGTGFTPSWATTPLVVTAELYKMGSATNIITDAALVNGAIRWYYKLSGESVYTQITSGSGNYTISGDKTQLTIAANKMSAAAPGYGLRCEIDYKHSAAMPILTYKMDIDYNLSRQGATGSTGATGAAAYTVISTNESHGFGADSAGNIASVLSTTTTISVLKGTTAQSVTIGALPTVTGLTLSVASNNTTAPVITVQANTGTTLAANGSFDITITADSQTFTKKFSWAKINNGATGSAGQNATSYWLVASNSSVVLQKAGTFLPATISVTGKSQVGTGTPADYAGRYIIAETTDGTAYTDRYTSGANEATKVYTPTGTTVKAIRVRMYLAGGTTTLLDEQVIPIVTDGVDTITSYAWAPSGNVFKNVLGTNPTLTSEFVIYNGITKVSSGITYKWYRQEPTVANSSSTISTVTSAKVFTVASATNFVVGQEIIVNSTATQIGIIESVAGTTITLVTALPVSPTVGHTIKARGYDATGGAGWYCLNNIGTSQANMFSGADTATLTIYSQLVPSMEVFKCIATYSSVNYTDTINIIDQTDPFQLDFYSTNGDVFKNGVGNTDVSCIVFQNSNSDIDPDGTILDYYWVKNDASGTLDATWIPYPKAAGVQAASGGTNITYTVASAGATCTINVSNGLVNNRYYFFGAETTPRKVTNVSGTTVTVTPTFPAAVGSATAVKEGNYKTIIITAAEVTEKATFFCDIA